MTAHEANNVAEEARQNHNSDKELRFIILFQIEISAGNGKNDVWVADFEFPETHERLLDLGYKIEKEESGNGLIISW